MILHEWQMTARKWLWQPERAHRLLASLKNLAKDLTLTQVAFALVLVPTLLYLYDETTHHVLVIDSINLPPDLSKNGFTSAVMVNQVGAAIRHIEATTQSQMKKDNVRLPQEAVATPSIEVPGTKLGINDLVAILRSVFRFYPQRITGDIVFPQSQTPLAQPALIPSREKYACDSAPSLAQVPVAVATVYATSPRGGGTSSVRFVVPRDDMDGLAQCTAEVVLLQVNPYILAVYKRQQGKEETALHILDQLLQQPSLEDGLKTAAYILQGDILADQKSYAKAEASFQKAIEIDRARRRWYNHPSPPHAADAYNSWGNMLEDRKDYTGAIEKYQMAIQLDPTDAMVYDDWGVAIDDQNQNRDPAQDKAAIDKFQMAIKLNPKDATAYLNWAEVIDEQNPNQEGAPYRAAKQYQAAIDKLQTSITLDPGGAPVHKVLGDIYRHGQEYEQADAEYQKAAELDPQYSTAFRSWGDLFLVQQRYPEAIERYQKSMQLDPAYKTYSNWGAALKGWDELNHAALASNQAKLKHDPKDSAARKALAEARDQQEKLLEARKQFDQLTIPDQTQEP